MATFTCPECSQPLRAGARFCGNCGHVITAADQRSQADRAAAPANGAPPNGATLNGAAPNGVAPGAGEMACPQCGNSVRIDGGFCPACGYSLAAAPAEGADQTNTIPQPGGQLGGQPTLRTPAANTIPAAQGVTRPTPISPAGPPSGPAAARPSAPWAGSPRPTPAPARRSPWLMGLLALAVVGCGVLAGGAYVLRQMGVLSAPMAAAPLIEQTPVVISPEVPATAVAAVVAASPTAEATLPMAATLPPADVTLPPADVTLPPTDPPPSPTVLMVIAATPSLAATEALSATQALAPAADMGTVLFEDSFDGELNTNWLAWGQPRPQLDHGPTDSWLYLKALDAGQAGVTVRPAMEIVNAPGAVFEFEARLDRNYPRAAIIFDWDRLVFKRGPDNVAAGLLRLTVQPKRAVLSVLANPESCSFDIDGTQNHIYTIRILNGQAVEVYVDQQSSPSCVVNAMGVEPQPGSISFSGLGWITRVKVIQP